MIDGGPVEAGRGARRLRAVALGGVVLVAAGLVAWLLFAGRTRRGAREVGAPDRMGGAPPASARAAVEAPATPDRAAGSQSRATPGPVAEDPEAALRRALLQADQQAKTSAEILEAKRLLEHVLRRRPELAAALAQALSELKNRELAFVITRLLGRFAREPAVRAALLALARDGSGLGREMALYTFFGLDDDPEVAGAAADAFLERTADERVRTAAAFGLVEMLPVLSEDARLRVRAEAREAVTRPDLGADVRAEAVDLLDVRGREDDRQTARLLLSSGPGTPPKVSLAAARVLLGSGEPPRAVLGALERLADGGRLDEASARSLRAMLQEARGQLPR